MNDAIKLSPYHKIFYNEWLLSPSSTKYNIVFDQTLSSTLNINILHIALQRFVIDYLLFNSHILEMKEELYWVQNTAFNELKIFDDNSFDAIYDYVRQPFDLNTKPLYRFAIFKENNGTYRFIIVLHHILIDGNSFNRLINEISNYYNSPSYKTSHSLLEQKSVLKNTTSLFDLQLEQFGTQYHQFWNERLSNIEILDLRWAKSENNTNKIEEFKFSLTQEVIAKLFYVAEHFGITTYAYSQCIFAILLYKYTSQDQIAFSYSVAIKGGGALVSGAQINTNIIVYELKSTTTVIDLFDQNKQFLKLAKSIGEGVKHYPISSIVNTTNKNLLDIMFIHTNLKNTPLNLDGVQIIKVNSDFNIDVPTKLLFELDIQNEILSFRMRYNTSEIDKTIIVNFINQYKNMFLKVLNDLNSSVINKPIVEYSVLSDDDYNRIIYQWNKTTPYYKFNKSIHELFEEQVLKTPDNIAVVYEGNCLTYADLNAQSNQLAYYLKIKCKTKVGDMVALYLDRSEYIIISIIGVLKVGAAYLPIDVTHPEKRIHYILSDSKAKVLITNKHKLHKNCNQVNLKYEKNSQVVSEDNNNHLSYVGQSITDNMQVIAIDDCNIQTQLKIQRSDNLDLDLNGDSLVYVMYTSGTTGNPKGVMLEQLGVTVRILAMIQKTGINSQSKYLFKTNYVFDVSFSDIFMTLLSGASLYVTKSIFDINEIHNLIVENNINICHFVPSQLRVIHDYPLKEDIFHKLEIINVSGEPFNKLLIHENTNIKYVNYYGPTEAGEVSCDITDIKNQLSEYLKLDTIGYPLNQSTLYILDSNLKQLPIGAIGELYIGGSGLARGYLNLPTLTKERFISNPFQTQEEKESNNNSRLYKTGDLVRLLPEGNIEYIGRSDNQIKIHGFRIELHEIETKLLDYPNIKHAIVLVKDTFINNRKGDQYLVAYYVSAMKLDENLICEYLAQELPEYMLPRVFVHLESLPLTSNGKLNKQVLPQADILSDAIIYLAPKNELEQKVCAIYADILKLDADKISVDANFFKLGGNSISAISLVFKLQNYFNITVNDIFEYKTPSKLVQFLPHNNNCLMEKLEQIKLMYSKLALNKKANQIAIEHEHTKYKQSIEPFKFDKKNRPISNVLLTGSTGYLGCHILYELLYTTNHVIYLPIRGKSRKISYLRLYNKFKYYFDLDLNIYLSRINIFPSDLSKTKLGLDESQYESIVNTIDSIIHCAALVKHYGNSDEFYSENTQTTINLLELAKMTNNKEFHYISTIGVFTNTRSQNSNYNVFTEDALEVAKANLDNLYTKTKYQGEQMTLKYREYGIKTSIYRVGNLAINSVTKRTQENIEDNAFFQRLKTILNLGIIPEELTMVEISAVNCVATAVVLIFNQEKLHNQIYHVFNPKKSNLYKLLCDNKISNIKRVTIPIFIDILAKESANNIDIHQVELFMLHQWGLQHNIDNLTEIFIFQDKTNFILNQLQFKWRNITSKMLPNITKKC